jgi:hypothetical protein
MTETQDDLWRDLSIVVKHVRFIAALFILALLVAVGTGLMADSNASARSELEIKVDAVAPLFGGMETIPTIETFENLVNGDQVAEDAARTVGITAEELKSRISVDTVERDRRDPSSVDRLSIETTGNSREQAQTIAGAVVDAFVEAAQELETDPDALESQQEQEALALERLEEFDQAQLIELAQVQADLSVMRNLQSTLTRSLPAIDQALELLEAEGSRPIEELMVAVAGTVGLPDVMAGTEQVFTVDELEGGLELRRTLAQGLIRSAQSDIEALAHREQELLVATRGQSAAMTVYTTAQRNLEATRLAATQTRVETTVVARAVDTSSGASWRSRLGAAAAVGLVGGVAGAFALEFVGSLWRRRTLENKASHREKVERVP